MVDPVSSNPNAISTLLRAQSAGATGLQARQATQNLPAKLAGGNRPSAVLASAKTAGPQSNLPRGSLVNIIA